MLTFVVIAVALFWVAGALGWRRSAARNWVLVDVAYYPLVALGVVIFFYEVEGTRAAFILSSVEALNAALAENLPGATELSEMTKAALAESQENLAAVQARQAQVATLAGIRSVAWPAIILLALSMKFAKGVATYRSAKAMKH